MNTTTKVLFITSTIMCLLTGCTSLKDFQKMDATTRADFVCTKDYNVKKFRDLEREYYQEVKHIERILSLGYNIHRSCKNVPVVKPGSISCTTYFKQTNCYQESKTTYEQVCTESPVSIDANLEKEKLKKYRDLLEDAKTETNNAYHSCYSKIKPMSAEQAFSYYNK